MLYIKLQNLNYKINLTSILSTLFIDSHILIPRVLNPFLLNLLISMIDSWYFGLAFILTTVTHTSYRSISIFHRRQNIWVNVYIVIFTIQFIRVLVNNIIKNIFSLWFRIIINCILIYFILNQKFIFKIQEFINVKGLYSLSSCLKIFYLRC